VFDDASFLPASDLIAAISSSLNPI
jgi:hypothetical protein